MAPEAIRKYFDGLVARLGRAIRLDFVEFPGSHPYQCHKNVDAYTAHHDGHRPVRGWLVTPTPGVHMFHAHSVVKQPSGRLIDVTPGEEHRTGLLFLEHLGKAADYSFLSVHCAQWFHPLPDTLLSDRRHSWDDRHLTNFNDSLLPRPGPE